MFVLSFVLPLGFLVAQDRLSTLYHVWHFRFGLAIVPSCFCRCSMRCLLGHTVKSYLFAIPQRINRVHNLCCTKMEQL